MIYESISQTQAFKGHEIILSHEKKRNSILTTPPFVWYWKTSYGEGYCFDKHDSIANAQKNIKKFVVKND